MLTLSTLADVSIKQIVETFNASFDDYIIPFRLTTEQLVNKIRSEDIVKDLSVGAFEKDVLVGFVLHGSRTTNGKRYLYNAGTGVLPLHRGNRIPQQLYEYLLPELQRRQYTVIQLEAITENVKAIKAYTGIGFKVARTFRCYKGSIVTQAHSEQKPFSIHELKQVEWDKLEKFWDWQPSWQNANQSIVNQGQVHHFIGAYSNEELVGYTVFNEKTKRIQQFAVYDRYRRKGIAKEMFAYISSMYGSEVSVINVEASSVSTDTFLRSIGLMHFISQYEMVLPL